MSETPGHARVQNEIRTHFFTKSQKEFRISHFISSSENNEINQIGKRFADGDTLSRAFQRTVGNGKCLSAPLRALFGAPEFRPNHGAVSFFLGRSSKLEVNLLRGFESNPVGNWALFSCQMFSGFWKSAPDKWRP